MMERNDEYPSRTAPSAPPEPPVPIVPVVSYSELYGQYPKTKPTSNNVNTYDHPPPVPWSTGLCDCCDDVGTCCLTCWCPCVTFGRIAEIVDQGSTPCGVGGALYTLIMCVTGCSCMYSCFYRSKLRGQYFLEERPCTDCCIHCFCEGCALCQEYRELKNHGFDMSIELGLAESSPLLVEPSPYEMRSRGLAEPKLAWERSKAETASSNGSGSPKKREAIDKPQMHMQSVTLNL